MNEWAGVTLIVLKFVSITLTSVFGVLGLLTTYKNKETGKVTPWGKIALGGIVASAIVAASTQAVELHRAGEAASRQQTQIAIQLREIRRAIDPLDSLTLTYEFSVDLRDPAFDAYRHRLEAMEEPGRIECERESARHRCDPSIYLIDFGAANPLFPRIGRQREAAAYVTLWTIGFDLFVFGSGTPFNAAQRPETADLMLSAVHARDSSDIRASHHPGADTMDITVTVDIPQATWHSNGVIASPIDFANAHIVSAAPNLVVVPYGATVRDVERLRHMTRLENIEINLPRGRVVNLIREKAAVVADDRGLEMMRWTIPSDGVAAAPRRW